MVLEKAQRLIQKDKEVKGLSALSEANTNFTARKDKLDGMVRRMQSVTAPFVLLRDNGIACEYQEAGLDTLVDQIKMVHQAYQANRDSIIDNDLSALERRIDKQVQGLQSTVNEAWQSYFEREVPEVNTQLVGLMRQFEDLRKDIDIFTALHQKVQRYGRAVPQSQEDLSRFRELAARYVDAWEHIQSSSLSGDVIDFLKAIAGHRATLSMLTNEVMAWLEAKGLKDKIRISLAR